MNLNYVAKNKQFNLDIDFSNFGLNQEQKELLVNFITEKKQTFSIAETRLPPDKLEELFHALIREIQAKTNELAQINANKQMKLHSFNESSVMGKLGVLILADFLLSEKICTRVINLDNNISEQMNGYDVILHLNLEHPLAQKWVSKFRKTELKVEIKTDAQNLTGNIALELYSNFQTKREGWSLTSKSDLILYFFINTHQLFIFETKLLNGLTKHFHNLFNPVYEFHKNNRDVGNLTSFELILYPKKEPTPFESTPYGKVSLSKGGVFSGVSKYNKPKSKRSYGLLDSDFFFSSFLEKGEVLKKHYNLNDTFTTFKTFKFAYVQAVNEASRRNPYFSLCLLFPIKLIHILNFSQSFYIPRNPHFSLANEFYFSKGGVIERKRRDEITGKIITDKIAFLETSYQKLLGTYIDNYAKQKFSEDVIRETFF